jgi:hypothetical protein
VALAGVALCAAACLVPFAWVSLTAAVVLVLWVPGRSLVRWLSRLDDAPGAGWSAIAASLVFMPLPLSWIWGISNRRPVVLSAVLAIDVVLLIGAHFSGPRRHPPPMFRTRRARNLLGVLVLWVAGCVCGSYWITRAGGRVVAYPAHDYIKHHAVLFSLDRYPLPLHSVFYAGEPETPYYYYGYHYLVPAAVRILSGQRVSIASVFGLTSAITAVVFVAFVFLIARDVLKSEWGALLAAACVSVVGGWDIVPALVRVAGGGPMVVTLDSWIPAPWRIHNLMTQYFWCPQHVSAVVALLVCCFWLRHAPSARWWILIAPMAAASIFGSSAYLAMTILPSAALYVALRFRSGAITGAVPARRLVAAVGTMVVLGLLLTAAQMRGYYVMSHRYPGGLTLHWERLPLAALGRLASPGPLANFLDAPWIILIELGLPALACLLISRRLWSVFWDDAGMRLLMIAGVVGTLALFTVRSDINRIDSSFRLAIIPGMVVAAVAAGALVGGEGLRPAVRAWRRPILLAGVVLGLPVGLYEAPATVARSLLLPDAQRGDAGAIRFIRDHTPPDAVVQGDPKSRLALAQLVDRQMGVLDPDDPDVRVFQPVSVDRMRRAFADVEGAFSADSSRSAWERLRRWGVTYVLVGGAERHRFGPANPFRDPAMFDMVYGDGQALVYRLIDRSGPRGRLPSSSRARVHASGGVAQPFEPDAMQ